MRRGVGGQAREGRSRGGGRRMRKRIGLVAGAVGLAFLLSSCWLLQSFSIADYTLTPGQSTKVSFTLRPMDASLAVTGRQFVIVGVTSILGGADSDIGVQKAVWGANGKFGGPQTMASTNGIVSALEPGSCSQAGLDFTDITGVQWAGFATPTNKNDKGKVNKSSVIEVTIKAKASAVTVGRNYAVMGVAGAWLDDGDGIPEAVSTSDDGYICWGIGSGGVTIV